MNGAADHSGSASGSYVGDEVASSCSWDVKVTAGAVDAAW